MPYIVLILETREPRTATQISEITSKQIYHQDFETLDVPALIRSLNTPTENHLSTENIMRKWSEVSRDECLPAWERGPQGDVGVQHHEIGPKGDVGAGVTEAPPPPTPKPKRVRVLLEGKHKGRVFEVESEELDRYHVRDERGGYASWFRKENCEVVEDEPVKPKRVRIKATGDEYEVAGETHYQWLVAGSTGTQSFAKKDCDVLPDEPVKPKRVRVRASHEECDVIHENTTHYVLQGRYSPFPVDKDQCEVLP